MLRNWTAAAAAFAGLWLAASAGAAHAQAACADLAGMHMPDAEVTAATVESLGASQACRVQATSKPTPDSDIRIEVWIPLGEAWNGKFVQIGNGGFAGQIPRQLRGVAAMGYAVAGTDNGHQSAVNTSAVWALGHPEKLVDFGWRAVKATTDVAKTLIATQKGTFARKSYLAGCSDGGREALMSAQRFPNDFDGIVAGAPANYMSRLFSMSAVQQQAMAKTGGWLGPAQLQLLQAGALAQCGGGTYVRDPASCRFDPRKLICRAGQADGCLTAAQARAAALLYDGGRDPRTGRPILAGFSPGAEATPGSWADWITGPSEARRDLAAGVQFSNNAFKYMAFGDPAYDVLKMDLGAERTRAVAKIGAVIDAASPDLRAFKARGGKLIQYHGWNDPAIPAGSSIVYYEDVQRTIGDPSGFYRLYMIPGMLHCAGGAGPSGVDWIAALDRWVTQGQAPEAVVAAAPPKTEGAAPETQLLCPYPAVAEGGACKPRGRSRRG